MKTIKAFAFSILLFFQYSNAVIEKPSSSVLRSVSIIAGQISLLIVAAVVLNCDDESAKQEEKLEQVTCYWGEWGTMMCNMVKTMYGGTIFVCYKQ